MALIKCQKCGRDVSSAVTSCPHCGFPIDAQAEQAKPPAPKKSRLNRAFLIVIAAFFVILSVLVAGGMLIIALNKPRQQEEAQKPSPETAKRFEECRDKLQRSQQLELLYDLEWKRAAPKVVVGPTFYTIPIDAKQGFAETVNCFLMAGKPNYIDFDLLDWRTGKRVARYSLGTLKMD